MKGWQTWLQWLPFFDSSVERWPTEARLLRWLTLLWVSIGLPVLFSASYAIAEGERSDSWYFFRQQVLWVLVGLCLFHAVVHIPLKAMLRLGAFGLFGGLVLLYATYFVGETRNEATRWIGVGSVLIQPSELIKPFLILQAAQLFGRWRKLSLFTRWAWLAVFGAVLLGILRQPSLSVTALCGMTLWAIALAAGLPLAQLGGAAGLGATMAVLSVAVNEYQRRRILSFLNPWQDSQGDGYQLVQSQMAIASGQVWGIGYGLSQQKTFLPFQYTDFIFAVFAEEFGLVGCVCLILLLLVYGTLGLRVALEGKDTVVRLVAIGATSLLVGQAFLNIGVATGLLPTTGLTFPFFSYGGSSMLASLTVAGLLVRSAREMATATVIPLYEQPAETLAERRQRLAARRSQRMG